MKDIFLFIFFTFISFSAICLLLLDIWITIMFYKYLEKLENVVPNDVRLAHVSLKGCSFRCLLLENFEVLKKRVGTDTVGEVSKT